MNPYLLSAMLMALGFFSLIICIVQASKTNAPRIVWLALGLLMFWGFSCHFAFKVLPENPNTEGLEGFVTLCAAKLYHWAGYIIAGTAIVGCGIVIVFAQLNDYAVSLTTVKKAQGTGMQTPLQIVFAFIAIGGFMFGMFLLHMRSTDAQTISSTNPISNDGIVKPALPGKQLTVLEEWALDVQDHKRSKPNADLIAVVSPFYTKIPAELVQLSETSKLGWANDIQAYAHMMSPGVRIEVERIIAFEFWGDRDNKQIEKVRVVFKGKIDCVEKSIATVEMPFDAPDQEVENMFIRFKAKLLPEPIGTEPSDDLRRLPRRGRANAPITVRGTGRVLLPSVID